MNSNYLIVYVPQHCPDDSDILPLLKQMTETGEITLIDTTGVLQDSEKVPDGPEVFVSKEDRHLTEYGHFLVARSIRHHLTIDAINLVDQ